MSTGGAYVSSLTYWGSEFDVEVTAISFLEGDEVTIKACCTNNGRITSIYICINDI